MSAARVVQTLGHSSMETDRYLELWYGTFWATEAPVGHAAAVDKPRIVQHAGTAKPLSSILRPRVPRPVL